MVIIDPESNIMVFSPNIAAEAQYVCPKCEDLHDTHSASSLREARPNVEMVPGGQRSPSHPKLPTSPPFQLV